MFRTVTVIVLLVFAVGCGGKSADALGRTYTKYPKDYKAGAGQEYCYVLANRSDKWRIRYHALGWLVTLGAGTLGLVAGLVGNKDEGSWYETNRAALIGGAGALITPIGPLLFSRSDAAGAATGEAKRAMALEEDLGKYKACLATHAQWNESLKSSTTEALKNIEASKGQVKALANERANTEAASLEEQARQLEAQAVQLRMQATNKAVQKSSLTGDEASRVQEEHSALDDQAALLEARATKLREDAKQKRDASETQEQEPSPEE